MSISPLKSSFYLSRTRLYVDRELLHYPYTCDPWRHSLDTSLFRGRENLGVNEVTGPVNMHPKTGNGQHNQAEYNRETQRLTGELMSALQHRMSHSQRKNVCGCYDWYHQCGETFIMYQCKRCGRGTDHITIMISARISDTVNTGRGGTTLCLSGRPTGVSTMCKATTVRIFLRSWIHVVPSPLDRWAPHRGRVYHPSSTINKEAIYQALGNFVWW